MNEEIGIDVEQTGQSGNDEAAAAAAAFAISRNEEPVEVVITEPEHQEPEVQEEKPEPKMFAGRTEDEVAALLAEIPGMKEGYRKQIDNLAGNYGKLNAAFQRLQQDTPNGKAVEVSDDDMAEMMDQYPELAGTTKAVLNKVLGRINLRGSAPAADPIDIDQRVSQLVEQGVNKVRVELNESTLNRLVPDWRTVIGVPDANKVREMVAQGVSVEEAVGSLTPQTDYRKWLSTQPPEYQQRISNSNDAYEIDDSVKAFKSFKESAIKKQTQNKQRLANAVQPTSSTTQRTALSEQQAAEAAFKRARGR